MYMLLVFQSTESVFASLLYWFIQRDSWCCIFSFHGQEFPMKRWNFNPSSYSIFRLCLEHIYSRIPCDLQVFNPR